MPDIWRVLQITWCLTPEKREREKSGWPFIKEWIHSHTSLRLLPKSLSEELKRQAAILEKAHAELSSVQVQLDDAKAEMETIKAVATVSESTKQEAIDQVRQQWQEEVASLQAIMKGKHISLHAWCVMRRPAWVSELKVTTFITRWTC